MSIIHLAVCIISLFVHSTIAQVQFQATSKTDAIIKSLQNEITQLKADVKTLSERSVASSGYCHLQGTGKCGPCLCFDDFELPQKYYCDCQNLPPKQDCLAHYQAGLRIDGIYRINMNGLRNVQAYCDQHSNGGGWTVIQRRMDGSENFYRNWTDYKHGFGKLHREFWWGNENTYYLTSVLSVLKGSEGMINYHLLGSSSTSYYYNRYTDFHIANESHKYKLHVKTGYSRLSGSYLTTYCNNAAFSTYDRDYDTSSGHCARKNYGGWWYNSCIYYCNLNSKYDNYYSRKSWQYTFHWGTNVLEFSEIKVRRLL